MSITLDIVEQVFTIDIIDDVIVIDEINGINVYDEGVFVGGVRAIDFVGSSVSAALSGTKVVVTVSGSGGGGGTWGSITGTLSDQTDLQAALDAKDAAGSASAAQAAAIAAAIGLQDLYVPAVAMWPRATGGCAAIAKSEMATSVLNIQSLDFDQTTQEFAQFTISLPRNWNNGTVTAKVYWTAAAGTGTVQWGISGGAYSNDDTLTVPLGTAQTSDDTLISTNDLHVSPETSAITLAGSPADGDFLAFQISRNPASDTLNADAKLLGVVITLTTDSAKAG